MTALARRGKRFDGCNEIRCVERGAGWRGAVTKTGVMQVERSGDGGIILGGGGSLFCFWNGGGAGALLVGDF